jgi:hypothetical protein
VTYSDISGAVSFKETVGPFEILDPALEAGIQQARTAAEAARNRGLAEDLERAQVPALRDMATRLEESLRLCELDAVATALELTFSGLTRARFAMLRQERTLSESLQAVLSSETVDSVDAGRSLDITRAGERLLGRPPTQEEADVFGHVARALGSATLVRLLVDHPDSVFR